MDKEMIKPAENIFDKISTDLSGVRSILIECLDDVLTCEKILEKSVIKLKKLLDDKYKTKEEVEGDND